MVQVVKIPAKTWTLISLISIHYQTQQNDLFVGEFSEVPEEEEEAKLKCLVSNIYTFKKREGNLYGYSKQGAVVVISDSVSSVAVAPDNRPFELSVVMGLVDGHSFVSKYGENRAVDTTTDPEDAWQYGGLYIYDDWGTAPIVSIVSDNADDTQTILIIGLDVDGYEVYQLITLNGTTRVALTTPLWRVSRMINRGSTDISGTVYCYAGTTDIPGADEVRAIIEGNDNQTQMALNTIPRGKVGFFMRGEVGGSRAQNAGSIQAVIFSRILNSVFLNKKRVDVTAQGTSVYIDKRVFAEPIPALTDIRMNIESVSSNGTGVFASYDILLVDEDKFSAEYLASIGQPDV